MTEWELFKLDVLVLIVVIWDQLVIAVQIVKEQFKFNRFLLEKGD